MTVRKVLIAACAAALTASPAWALPGRAGSHDRGSGRSHRCVAHGVGYVAAGTLVSQTLVLDAGSGGAGRGRGGHARPTYSGDVTIAVTRANAHARPDKGTTKTYTLTHARVLLGLADTNADGSVGLDDLAAGDRVQAIGKVTVLRRGCDQTGFTPTVTIGKLIVHAPAKQQPTG